MLHFLTASATKRKRLLRDLSTATLSRGQEVLILGSRQETGITAAARLAASMQPRPDQTARYHDPGRSRSRPAGT